MSIFKRFLGKILLSILFTQRKRKKRRVTWEITCDECNGEGLVQTTSPTGESCSKICFKCGGTGKVQEEPE